ncbi:hypothetical protein K2X92_05810 [Candidatus Gracilibacteria bacterium]|nr:hypothetical protein [Candidatus Gracilibacteria bacterium]
MKLSKDHSQKIEAGQEVEFDPEEPSNRMYEVPDYLSELTNKVKLDIMYTVLGLFPNPWNISEEDIQMTLIEIDSEGNRKLWTQYFQEALKLHNTTMH